jgi:hypothetical protein
LIEIIHDKLPEPDEPDEPDEIIPDETFMDNLIQEQQEFDDFILFINGFLPQTQ